MAVVPDALATVTFRYVAGTLMLSTDVYPAVLAVDVRVPAAPTGSNPAESMYRCTVTVRILLARIAATAELKLWNGKTPDDQVTPVGIAVGIGLGGMTLNETLFPVTLYGEKPKSNFAIPPEFMFATCVVVIAAN